jgi:hypothetical protein
VNYGELKCNQLPDSRLLLPTARPNAAGPYSSCLTNSTPINFPSPTFCDRRTRARIGGVSGGTLENASSVGGGAGIVSCNNVSTFSALGLARNAPDALILNVLVRSKNDAPDASTPFTNIGICRRILGERRRSAGLKRVPSLLANAIFIMMF